MKKKLTPSKLPPFFSDRVLLITAIVLVCFSMLMIYSTTGVVSEERYGDAYYFVKRQGAAALIGFVALIICSYLNLNKVKAIAPYFLLTSLILLILVYIPGLGISGGGAQRWINLGVVRFQPVELVKILMIFFLAAFISKHEFKLDDISYAVVRPLVYLSLVAMLILMQPDFGSTAVLYTVALIMFLAAGVHVKYLLGGGALLTAAGTLLVVISPYRMKRILSFMDPYADSSGQGYQLIQSLIAIGNGGVGGVGLGASQQKLFFLPAAHTDFIFSVIAEELGFIGCLVLILFFLLILWRGIKIATQLSDDTFCYSLTLGLTLLIVLPALLNMGIALGLLPTKGLALPFVSYGGSSMIVSLMAIGLLLALSRTQQRRAR